MSFYGDNINRFFFGIVVNNNDHLNLGRVQIRVFGVHGPEIQNHDLPFAQVVMPSTEPGIGGAGSPRMIGIGAQVFGVFLDGKDSQLPLVMGTVPKIMRPSATTARASTGDTTSPGYEEAPQIDTTDVPNDIIEFIQDREGFGDLLPDGRVQAYWDYGQYSIGFGTRATGPNEIITREEAEARLREEVAGFRQGVISRGARWGYEWNDNQIDALTSFSYNLGLGALDQLTANGSRSNTEISERMLLYVNAGGERLPGLVTRRAMEQAIFIRP